MKLFLLICSLSFSSIIASAQQSWNETKEQKYRRLMSFDYTVPDYNVDRPDAAIMGWRLAKTLEALEKNYVQGLYNNILTQIFNEQLGEHNSRPININKLKIKNIAKKDSVITVIVNVVSKSKTFGKINLDLKFVFVNSLSDSDNANFLFSDLARYIREDE